MKRSSSSASTPTPDFVQDPTKKVKVNAELESSSSSELGEDLILEILKKSDARTLARAACASKRWKALVEDERVWEAVCTRHWASIGCGAHQMRAVVIALGGFKKLHSAYLLPLLQPATRPRRGFKAAAAAAGARWGRDEVQLSMALLSIGFFEKMGRR